MCRLLITTGQLPRATALRLLRETALKFANTQRDGFGFAAFDEKGSAVAYGRYYDTYTGWRKGKRGDSDVIEVGEIPNAVHTLIIHGRTSTNVLGVDYCHPYALEDTYLAHNGVLQWIGPKDQEPKHANDSGALLEWLVANDHPSPAQWSKYWAGYGAIALMRPDRGLSIIKCGMARLSISELRKGGSILATAAHDIPGWLKDPRAGIRGLTPGILEFDQRGVLQRYRKFKGFAARRWDSRARKALGSRPTQNRTRVKRYPSYLNYIYDKLESGGYDN